MGRNLSSFQVIFFSFSHSISFFLSAGIDLYQLPRDERWGGERDGGTEMERGSGRGALGIERYIQPEETELKRYRISPLPKRHECLFRIYRFCHLYLLCPLYLSSHVLIDLYQLPRDERWGGERDGGTKMERGGEL